MDLSTEISEKGNGFMLYSLRKKLKSKAVSADRKLPEFPPLPGRARGGKADFQILRGESESGGTAGRKQNLSDLPGLNMFALQSFPKSIIIRMINS
jgi:hypothetical protein